MSLTSLAFASRQSGSVSKESACNAGDLGSIPGSGRSPGEWNGYPLQYSCLENSKDRGAWWPTVQGVLFSFFYWSGQRTRAGYSLQRHTESDATQVTWPAHICQVFLTTLGLELLFMEEVSFLARLITIETTLMFII